MPNFRVDVTADPHRPRVVGPDNAPFPAVNDFLEHLESCARSPYTVGAYARGLAHFVDWLHQAGVELDAVTRPMLASTLELSVVEGH
jgi:site-specific recombinase XerD